MGRLITLVLALLLLGSTQAATLVFTTYYHNDHLGSPAAATDERNELLWRAHYRPYGERQENPADTPYGSPGYTGHVQDGSSGLVYMQARYYDPQLGRFLAMDPAGPQEEVPGSFNRYAYGLNNPYRYVDPDGQWAIVVEGALLAGAAMMIHSDFANAPAQGEASQSLGIADHLGVLPGLQVSKGRSVLRMMNPAEGSVVTSRAARREVMREAGIPTSQQPVSQMKTVAGRQQIYEVPTAGGGSKRMAVTDQTTDRVPGHGPHWEAGPVKTPERVDPLGRIRVSNEKSKVEYEK